MRAFLKSSRRWLTIGWFWPLVLLALPNCASLIGVEDWNGGPTTPSTSFDPGPGPRTSLIMCDIPLPDQDPCLLPTETGVALENAAVALIDNESSANGLDLSPDVVNNQCNLFPGKTVFYGGKFPDGYPVCLNSIAQIPVHYADPNEVCVAQCKDLIMLDGGSGAFCQMNAHVSTNFDPANVYLGACNDSGTPLLPPDFVDPRRAPVDVAWTDFIKTTPEGTSSLKRPATSEPPTGEFDAGAVSKQLIFHGNGWVEFAANETGVSHVLGLSHVPCDPDVPDGCNPPPIDSDASLLIDFTINLNADGRYYLLEGGNLVTGPDINESYGTYDAHDRFRIQFNDNLDGTAAISYWWIDCSTGPCIPQKIDHDGAGAKYPLRVDSSFREPNATLENVTRVFINDFK